MSTNIHFIATREIKVIKTNKISIQEIRFNEWQTPTRVTREIMESNDPIEAYKDWILRECSRDEEFPIYAEDDIFGQREPVGRQIYNAGKEHLEQFNKWLKMCDEEGYTVVAEAW
jgi:hypothetical protein